MKHPISTSTSRRNLLAGPSVLLTLTLAAPGATLHVPSGQSIQAAINLAVAGDTITVAPGTYSERISISKNVSLVSTGGPQSTVIHGGGSGTTVSMSGAASITGFTITGGNNSFGAGMSVSGVGGRITGNIFTGNRQGGGGYGAAIGGNSASPIITGNVFTNNSSDLQFLSGAVSFINSSSPIIQNNLFYNNQGRGLNITAPAGSAPVVSNNTFRGNTSAIRLDARVDTSAMTFRNNILANNGEGLEVDFYGAGRPFAAWNNNLLNGNGTGYSGIFSFTDLYGNIEGNPLFADAANADFRLLVGSPAIDAGTTTAAPLLDFLGNPRPVDGNGDGVARTDIGAYEFIPEPGVSGLLGLGAVAWLARRRRKNERLPWSGALLSGHDEDSSNDRNDRRRRPGRGH